MFRRLHFISSIAFPFLHEFESLNSKCHQMLPNHSGDATSWSFLDIFPALNSGRQRVYQGTVTQRLIVSILYVKTITVNVVPIRSMSFFPSFARLHLKTLRQTSTRTYPPPAYDTFPQEDATATNTEMPHSYHHISHPTCREWWGSAAVLCWIRWLSSIQFKLGKLTCHGSLVGLKRGPACLNPHL